MLEDNWFVRLVSNEVLCMAQKVVCLGPISYYGPCQSKYVFRRKDRNSTRFMTLRIRRYYFACLELLPRTGRVLFAWNVPFPFSPCMHIHQATKDTCLQGKKRRLAASADRSRSLQISLVSRSTHIFSTAKDVFLAEKAVQSAERAEALILPEQARLTSTER